MTSTDVRTASSSAESAMPGTVDMKLEVVVVARLRRRIGPSSFYQNLGWRLDADFAISDDFRVLQFTPTGSQASIIFGTGVTDATPGSAERLLLVVQDIEAARADLVGSRRGRQRGFPRRQASSVTRDSTDRIPGRRPSNADRMPRSLRSATRMATAGCCRRSRSACLAANGGSVAMDVAALADLLHETAEHHDPYEKSHPPHNWWDWYAPYITLASTAARLSRPPPRRDATWRNSAMWFRVEVQQVDRGCMKRPYVTLAVGLLAGALRRDRHRGDGWFAVPALPPRRGHRFPLAVGVRRRRNELGQGVRTGPTRAEAGARRHRAATP